jgi:urease accessory protein
MLTLTQRRPADPTVAVRLTLSLTAEERTRSRHHFQAGDGQSIYLHLPRGTVLHHGDLLASDADDTLVRVTAKPEPVLTVTAPCVLDLLRAAYHLGNRHVPLEVQSAYLRLSPDPVLRQMLEQLGLQVHEERIAFQPEVGAYGQTHQAHSHAHS